MWGGFVFAQEDEVLPIYGRILLFSFFGVSQTREPVSSVPREARVLPADLHPGVFVYFGFFRLRNFE
jgi:hypothetical protein